MSFIITFSKGDIVVKENKNTVLIVRMPSSDWERILWINIMHRRAFNYTYLYSNPEFLDRAESSLIAEYIQIHLSGLIL